MTSAEIAHELRAARPSAPPALRARILADAARTPSPSPSPSPLLRLRRRWLLLAPAAVLAATVGAVAVALTGSDAQPPATVALDRPGADADLRAQGEAAPLSKAPSAPTRLDRAQRIVASLSLRVADGNALSAAVRDAVRITRSLDGYVVTSDVVSGDTGSATLSVRVPAQSAQDAIARLSELGTIVGQRVQADDVQETLDALVVELTRLRKALAVVRAQLADDTLTAEQRAALRARRDQLTVELRATTAQHTATAAAAATATIDLSLTTGKQVGAVVPSSRLDRTLTRALDVLAWEAVTVLGLLVVLAPLGIGVAGLRLARRSARRWSDDRALGAS